MSAWIVMLIIVLGSCSCKQEYNNIPLHRLQIIEQPNCKKETYRDIIECVILYHSALELSNRDKEAIRNIVKEK